MQFNRWLIPLFKTKQFTALRLACGQFAYFFSSQPCNKKLDVGSLRILQSPSMLQQRITEIDQLKEELKIEVRRCKLLVTEWHKNVCHIKGKEPIQLVFLLFGINNNWLNMSLKLEEIVIFLVKISEHYIDDQLRKKSVD